VGFCGSSPRERGTLRADNRRLSRERFIPARAGNTTHVSRQTVRGAVHPRASGEHRRKCTASGQHRGSSPRERGTQNRKQAPPPRRRFIPARAGNTRVELRDYQAEAVHPRASGEHESQITLRQSSYGSSPRERGTHHGRVQQRWHHRFIPARAGNTWLTLEPMPPSSVHPRASGEHIVSMGFGNEQSGSSPRERGTPFAFHAKGFCQRFIPARAGNTQVVDVVVHGVAVHPRASGEHRTTTNGSSGMSGSSPRERGTPHEPRRELTFARFIPARAGNTSPTPPPTPARTVHPRASGEHMESLEAAP